ncbi:MAG TPA: AraC family transcriptional regulator [Chitinophaga sp.]|uniref:helix-turn-helix domain-containing protein n=1 Tax=Chitinophaga sp. TaxID=1869181 RepID=UPI002DB7C048|nr:AraC family transcriptional regulator [Chitinophaga sp.]HEU4552347.1 AraC family transcriptional regulator [Chitinophaga sp.]
MARQPQKIPVYPLERQSDAQFSIRRVMRAGPPDNREWIASPHRHNFYFIGLVQQGAGKHLVDFKEYTMAPNTLNIISPHQVHHVHQQPDAHQTVKGVALFFTRDFVQSHPLLDNIEWMGGQLHLDETEMQLLLALCEQLLAAYEQQQTMSDRIIRSYLDIFFSHVHHMMQERQAPHLLTNDARIVKTLQQLIHRHFLEQKSAGDYAALLHLTPGYLSDVVKKQTGKSPSQLIADRVILEAKRLLVHTTGSVKEIAYQLNFNEATYFYRFFKKYAGQTPEQFREEIRKKYSIT